MARLVGFNMSKKNHLSYSTAVAMLLNSTKVLDFRAVTDNYTGTSTTYTKVDYAVGDNSAPDVLLTTDSVSTLNTEMNTDPTTTTTASIALTVQDNTSAATLYTKYFNPLYIHMVLPHPSTSNDSLLMYQPTGFPMESYRVDETVAAIKSAANA